MNTPQKPTHGGYPDHPVTITPGTITIIDWQQLAAFIALYNDAIVWRAVTPEETAAALRAGEILRHTPLPIPQFLKGEA